MEEEPRLGRLSNPPSGARTYSLPQHGSQWEVSAADRSLPSPPTPRQKHTHLCLSTMSDGIPETNHGGQGGQQVEPEQTLIFKVKNRHPWEPHSFPRSVWAWRVLKEPISRSVISIGTPFYKQYAWNVLTASIFWQVLLSYFSFHNYLHPFYHRKAISLPFRILPCALPLQGCQIKGQFENLVLENPALVKALISLPPIATFMINILWIQYHFKPHNFLSKIKWITLVTCVLITFTIT